jgi:hypothetical protein
MLCRVLCWLADGGLEVAIDVLGCEKDHVGRMTGVGGDGSCVLELRCGRFGAGALPVVCARE